MKIAIFLPNWVGDLVMATPTLRAIRRHAGPDARLVGIMRPYLADVLGGTGWLDRQWFLHPRSKEPGTGFWALVRRMRAERFDAAVLLTNTLRPAMAAWLGAARERIGYVLYGRGPLLTTKLYPRRAGRRLAPAPVVDTYLALARALGCPPESPRLELATTDRDRRRADAVWADLGLRDDGRVLIFNGSGAYGGAKLWPAGYFAALARRVAERLDHDVLVICGPKELQIARDVVRMAGNRRVFSMAGQPLDLGTAKACIRRGRLMVSTDSGPRHVAAAFGLPVVTLFGPMLPTWSENPTQRAGNLMLELDCIGCHKRVCPVGHHKCMRELTVDMVFSEVVKLLRDEEDAASAAA